MSNGELLIVKKHCEKRLPLKQQFLRKRYFLTQIIKDFS